MTPDSLHLPPRPNLAHLKRQAKKLVRDHKAGDVKALGLLRTLRRFEGRTDDEILSAPLALHDAQYALALSYGCESWNALRARVESSRKAEQESAGPLGGGSLYAEVDAVNDAFFWHRPLSGKERSASARFIARFQGGPGSYAGMFRPGEGNAKALRLFTGERTSSGPGNPHILGEEACRALRLLDVRTPEVRGAMKRAESQMIAGVESYFGRTAAESASLTRLKPGTFCCMKCSTALWRHLLARDPKEHAEFLAAGLKALKSDRDGKGGWQSWPFAYTLSALIEWDMDEALSELRYSAPACQRELKRGFVKTNVYSQRRREVMKRALDRC